VTKPAVDATAENSGSPKLEWFFPKLAPPWNKTKGSPAGSAFSSNTKTLVRETGQNASDAQLDEASPVTVEYLIIDLVGNDAKEFLNKLDFDSELRPRVERCAEDVQRHHVEFKNGLEQLAKDGHLRLIKISDYNAVGLTGPEFGGGHFEAVCKNLNDSQKLNTAGGSYGLGKATMWAASWMSVVITNSRLSAPQSEPKGMIESNRFFVRADLPYHEIKPEDRDSQFIGPGWFGQFDSDQECTVSHEASESLVTSLFVDRADERPGTTFLIVGARDPAGELEDKKDLAEAIYKAVENNFWPAMVEGAQHPRRLVARVGTQDNHGEPQFRDVQTTPETEPFVATLESYFSQNTVAELEEPGDVVAIPVTLQVPARTEGTPHAKFDHTAILLVAYTDEPAGSPTVNRYTYLRGNRMVIKDQKLRNLPLGARQFHAILLAGLAAGTSEDDVRADEFLREAEPPAHDSWTNTASVEAAYLDGATATRLSDFDRAVKDAIRDAIGRTFTGSSGGPESLKELLRLKQPVQPESRPRVKQVTSKKFDSKTGAWTITAEVTLPPEKRWTLKPVLKVGTDSGADINVDWAADTIKPGKGCTVKDGRLISSAGKGGKGVKKLTFTATSDPASFPVDSKRVKVRVDLASAAPYGGDGE
jgi:hypothetical protein